MAKEHPKWKLCTIRANGGTALTRMDELKRWEKEIQRGGTQFDKSNTIKKWLYNRFVESRAAKIPVMTRNIQAWAMQAARQFESSSFTFYASYSWVARFKKEFHIGQRRVTRYIKPTEAKSLDDVLKALKEYEQEYASVIPKYDQDFVINTDQIGCEYRINVHRTLEHRGKKSVQVNIGDMNKVTHSYTVQYTITASGKLLPVVFICLQEPQAKFGPQIKKRIEALTHEYGNVYITFLNQENYLQNCSILTYLIFCFPM